MRARRARAIAALAVGVGAAPPALVLASGEPVAREPQAQPAVCRPGAAPTRPYGERPPEGFLRYGTRPIVIGCATLASGRRFELVGYQLGREGHRSLCIDTYEPARRVGWGCGSNLVVGGGAISATSTTRWHGQPDVVAGTLSSAVARVRVRFELGGRLRETAAAVVMVRDPALLRAIAVREPFGRYLAEVPARARAASAEARGPRGRTLGLAFFPGYRGPAGEGRLCYGRPRVASLRLLEPARAGHRSRLRVVLTYPGGDIGSVDATVGGRGTVHTDLGPPASPSKASRRVVTVPLRFKRLGSVAVDVTAEGRPLGRRCGTNPPLRRSDARTLVVRVR